MPLKHLHLLRAVKVLQKMRMRTEVIELTQGLKEEIADVIEIVTEIAEQTVTDLEVETEIEVLEETEATAIVAETVVGGVCAKVEIETLIVTDLEVETEIEVLEEIETIVTTATLEKTEAEESVKIADIAESQTIEDLIQTLWMKIEAEDIVGMTRISS